MNGFNMEQAVQEVIGNPVDMWWNETRQHINIHISLLRNIPLEFDGKTSAKELETAYDYLVNAYYPPKAAEIYAYLLRSVENLRTAIIAIQNADRQAILENYNMAYNRYIMVCRLLLDRGIFEPVPRITKPRIQ
jgi:hypothetical protein